MYIYTLSRYCVTRQEKGLLNKKTCLNKRFGKMFGGENEDDVITQSQQRIKADEAQASSQKSVVD